MPLISSRPPVVLQVLPALNDGGVEQSTLDMAQALLKHGWGAVVASSGGHKASKLARIGADHVFLPLNSKSPLTLLFNAWRLGKLATALNISLIHARSRAPAWSAWLASKLSGVPFITTFHGTYSLKGGPLKRFYNSVMTRGPIVIANSQFIARHIEEQYGIPPQNIVVATRGIDPTVFNPTLYGEESRKSVLEEIGVEHGTPLLLMVGRISAWKGQGLLLEALASLKDIPWKLAFVGAAEGKGDYADKVRTLSKQLGLQERVVFLGSRDDVARLLNAASLAFSCSIRPEAFGRVAIEAMAMECPVVATALGGSLETIVDGKTGWLVYPDQNGEIRPQELSETIRKALLKPQQLATMGKAARRHVLANYTAEKCCEAEMQAYERLLGLKGHA